MAHRNFPAYISIEQQPQLHLLVSLKWLIVQLQMRHFAMDYRLRFEIFILSSQVLATLARAVSFRQFWDVSKLARVLQ